ncbi:MAG: TIGR01777 family oxidoreductase [Pirellulales bacterium]
MTTATLALPTAPVVVSGASGLVGQELCHTLAAHGVGVRRLVRGGASDPGTVAWDPVAGRVDVDGLKGCGAVVHLAGENIAEGRWTTAKKQRIRDSRVQGTRLLCEALARMPQPPATLVCASAIGIYGDRGDELLTEDSATGTGFLAEVGVAWEEATRPAVDAGVRVVQLRIGIVLTRQGGALARMLLPFRCGLGGVVGHGRQYWSWVTLPDLVQMVEFALATPTLRGPVNAVAPQAVTNREFTKVLGRVLRRPTLFPLPALVGRLVLGEMSDALLLASTRVVPARLQAAGYRFLHPALDEALRAVLQ